MSSPTSSTPAAYPPVPPDSALQAERTSLSWARTWAVVGANIVLVAKLIAEESWLWAAGFSLFAVVPFVALIGIQREHARRVHRFIRAGEVEQTQATYNAGLVLIVILIAAAGLIAVVVHAVR